MKLFVYGTLKTEPQRRDLVPNFRLIDVGWFPGALPAEPTSHVVGQVIDVDDAELAQLDFYEGVPSLYTRETVRVITESGEEISAFMYVLAASVGERHDGPSVRVLEERDENDKVFWTWRM